MAVHIRLATPRDAGPIARLYRPIVESTAISFETSAPDEAEMARRISDTLQSHPWLVCDVGEQVAGYAYATRHRVRGAYQWSVDTSVYTNGAFRRKGVGRGLYESLLAILTAQGYVNAYAGIALPNPASVALHESMGFRPVGVYRRVGYKLGRWHDVGWWERTLRPHEHAPKEPTDLATVSGQPGWETLLMRGEAAVRADAETKRAGRRPSPSSPA